MLAQEPKTTLEGFIKWVELPPALNHGIMLAAHYSLCYDHVHHLRTITKYTREKARTLDNKYHHTTQTAVQKHLGSYLLNAAHTSHFEK